MIKDRRQCWYVVWKYEFRSGVFFTLTSLARELKESGIGYWTLYRILREQGSRYHNFGSGIEIHATEVYK